MHVLVLVPALGLGLGIGLGLGMSHWDDAPLKDTATSTCTKCGGRLQHEHTWLARTASWLARMARGQKERHQCAQHLG